MSLFPASSPRNPLFPLWAVAAVVVSLALLPRTVWRRKRGRRLMSRRPSLEDRIYSERDAAAGFSLLRGEHDGRAA